MDEPASIELRRREETFGAMNSKVSSFQESDMEYSVFKKEDLPIINGVRVWEGRQLGDSTISVLFVDLSPGHGPQLHLHPYEEVFLVHAGKARFTIGQSSVDIVAGQLVVVGAHVPHKFENCGESILRQTDIHLSATIETTWLE